MDNPYRFLLFGNRCQILKPYLVIIGDLLNLERKHDTIVNAYWDEIDDLIIIPSPYFCNGCYSVNGYNGCRYRQDHKMIVKGLMERISIR